jgi:hypothetical protein
MTVDDERVLRRQLVDRVRARRIDIDGFLDRARPRNSRLAAVGVVSSAPVAVFTGGPAIGGKTFAKAAQGFVGSPMRSAASPRRHHARHRRRRSRCRFFPGQAEEGRYAPSSAGSRPRTSCWTTRPSASKATG